MTVDAIMNILLISFFAGVLEILAVSNIGYVLATCTALSGFLLLRKDRPNWPRPVKLSFDLGADRARFCLAANLVLPDRRRLHLLRRLPRHRGLRLWLGQDTHRPAGASWSRSCSTFYRHVVQDKIPLQLRGGAAAPEEEDRPPRPGGRTDGRAPSERRHGGPCRPPRRLGCSPMRVLALADKRPPLDPALIAERMGVDAVVCLGDLDRAWIEPLAHPEPSAPRRTRQPRCARSCCARSRSRTSTDAARHWAG